MRRPTGRGAGTPAARAGGRGRAVRIASTAAGLWILACAPLLSQAPSPTPPLESTPSPTPAATPPATPPVPLPTPPVPSGEPAAPPAAAPSEKIVGIRVVGSQTVSPETIGHYLGIKVGERYDPETIRANFQTLWSVGLLENLAVEAERGAEGVTLIIRVEERPTITAIDFSGNKKVSASQIKDRLREEKIELRAGAPLSLPEIARTRAAIADYYVEQGYRSATVEFRIEDVSKTEKKVVFAIDEGDKVKIASIRFEGVSVFPQWRLRNAMKKTKQSRWWRILSENTTYSQANYDADVESVKSIYHSKGYKDVVVKDPVLEVYEKNPKARKIKRRVRIVIPVVEGEQFFTGDIRLVRIDRAGQPAAEGAPTVFPKERLLAEFYELKPGTVLNRDRLIEALSRIETVYKSRGYIFWFADPAYREAGNRRVDVDVRLFEGDRYYLGRLEVKGNTTTLDKVIRREFALDEGDIMDMEAVKKSLQKLQQLGYFRIAEEPDFQVRDEEKKVDLTLKGTETSKNEIQFGAGYSAQEGFFGQFSFQTRNFLGRGEILGASAQIGRISDYYDLSYTIPWFMDRNQSLGFSLFQRNLEYLNIEERRQGGSAFYGRGLGIFDSWSVLYQYEDIQANFPARGAPVPPGQPAPPEKFTDVRGRTSSITPGYRYDSHNDPFDPNRGSRLYGTAQVAGSFLGGTDSFVKPLLGASTFLPVRFPRNAYLGINLEGGWVTPYSGGGIPIFERFQIGGEQSIRGYRTGSVLPLEETDQGDRVFTDESGRILGGDKFFVLNVEYTFLTAGPAKLLAFVDAGNVYHEDQTFNPLKVRYSVGAELRIFLPIFQAPLRFIYSFNPDPRNPVDQFGFPIRNLRDRRSGFDFSIGRTF